MQNSTKKKKKQPCKLKTPKALNDNQQKCLNFEHQNSTILYMQAWNANQIKIPPTNLILFRSSIQTQKVNKSNGHKSPHQNQQNHTHSFNL